MSINTYTLTPEDNKSLKLHLANIEINQEIANASSDVEEVRSAVDSLLKSIDYILTFDEKSLNKVGMSKAKLPSQKSFIKKNYNVILEQTRGRSLNDL